MCQPESQQNAECIRKGINMTGDIILQLCKTLLSSFLFTVQVTAFKGSRQQNTQKKGGGVGTKNGGMEPFKKRLARLEPYSWKLIWWKFWGGTHQGSGLYKCTMQLIQMVGLKQIKEAVSSHSGWWTTGFYCHRSFWRQLQTRGYTDLQATDPLTDTFNGS